MGSPPSLLPPSPSPPPPQEQFPLSRTFTTHETPPLAGENRRTSVPPLYGCGSLWLERLRPCIPMLTPSPPPLLRLPPLNNPRCLVRPQPITPHPPSPLQWLHPPQSPPLALGARNVSLVGANRRAPSRECSNARVYVHLTTATHEMSHPPPASPPPPPKRSPLSRAPTIIQTKDHQHGD